MSINDRMIFTTPTAREMVVRKTSLPGRECPDCGGSDIARYPVGHYKGPRMVTKCQNCYHTLEVERPVLDDNWPPFRSATYDWEVSPVERVGRKE